MADGLTNRVLAAIERRRMRGTTCHEIAEELELTPALVGKALGNLNQAGLIHQFTNRREGQAVITVKG